VAELGGPATGGVFLMQTGIGTQLAHLNIVENEPLARYTSARIGGPADWLLVADSIPALMEAAAFAQREGMPWRVLGSGSNVLVADAGVAGLVIVNKARRVSYNAGGRVSAESGANLSSLARGCIARGLAGLEWAVSVPGTVGGAVVGNAGAHGGDMAGNLVAASMLGLDGAVVEWPVTRFRYGYRDSALKGMPAGARPLILKAELQLGMGNVAELSRRAETFVARRKSTQPPGASMGSMFKNPPGDYAGRLIERAGLKGMRVGGAQISPVHANFFVNTGTARAADVKTLIDVARKRVRELFGVELTLEIELIGKWPVSEG
jgi:UDP-N-acetylmuramate dehydrogenase